MNNINEDKCYKIYVHINKTNGKKYIGQTKQSLDQRFRSGKGYKNSPKFYGAIEKYGWDGFEHVLLFDNLTLTEANQKEEELIKKYDTTDDANGYNIAYGGDNHNISEETVQKILIAKQRQVDRYDKNGVYIDSFDNAKIAGRILNINPSGIYACCKDVRKSAGNFIWKYHNDESDIVEYENPRYKKVVQIDKHTLTPINKFNSISEAGEYTSINKNSIRLCCKKELKTAGCYIWRYIDDSLDIDLDYINTRQANKNTVKVNVYKNNILVHTFNSNAETVKNMKELYGYNFNASKISEVCHRNRNHHYGFVFRYEYDDEFNTNNK